MVKSRWKRSLYIIIAGVFVYLCFRYFLSFALPILFAWFLAALLRRPVYWLKKKLRIPAALSGLLGILSLLFCSLAVSFLLLRGLLNQFLILLQELPMYRESLFSHYSSLCDSCDRALRLSSGSSLLFFNTQLDAVSEAIRTTVLPAITERSLRIALGATELFALLIIIVVAAVLLIKDMEDYRSRFRASFLSPILLPIFERLRYTALAYLRAQGIIMLVTGVLCTLGFILIKNPYALLLGASIALVDALPLLGSGIILLPWSLVLLSQRNYRSFVILLVLFLVCVFVREFLEPKLLGKGIGIRPLYTITAMYLGIRLFGIMGFLLGPLGFVILKTIWEMTAQSPDSPPSNTV